MKTQETIESLRAEREALEAEVQVYRDAAKLYGVDVPTMLALAKSQIKTAGDNIRIVEKMQEVLKLFDSVPDDLTDNDLVDAIIHYDGDNSKPYCDLVYCGLCIIRRYLKKRGEYDEWRKGHVPDIC